MLGIQNILTFIYLTQSLLIFKSTKENSFVVLYFLKENCLTVININLKRIFTRNRTENLYTYIV